MGQQNESKGTGTRFALYVTILAGASSIVAVLLTCLSVFLQSKNYRKPLLQRYVIRILLMVPVYAIASWASLYSLKIAFWIDPFVDVYEAFTLYAFVQLLINFLGGERALIIMMHGRAPVKHLWPMDLILPKVDISDPHTFLAIKRSILQYTWVKPLLAVATIAMKATGTFQEGYIGLKSGYLWSGIIYNTSITITLYALALFWVCMTHDLQPFRPMPKFLCIKGIIFASYWQGFFLSILVWLGIIRDYNSDYSADNLAAAIQDALICFEMPIFALAHWYAFSWHDYADKTISDARMPVSYALRDAFGPKDLIEDAKETFYGTHYKYRFFDANDNVLTHEDSRSREARMAEGMRYSRSGGKYWLPESSKADDKTPLLAKVVTSRARAMLPQSSGTSDCIEDRENDDDLNEDEEIALDPDEETLYENARALEFGDWNYPVINTHFATKEDRLNANPEIITASTNATLLQPGTVSKQRMKKRIRDLRKSVSQRENDDESGSSSKDKKRALLSRKSSSSSAKSDSSQRVDLVVEDTMADQIEEVRARKEGGGAWNTVERKHFVRMFPGEVEEAVVEEYAADSGQVAPGRSDHDPGTPLNVGNVDELDVDQPWKEPGSAKSAKRAPNYDDLDDGRDAWKNSTKSKSSRTISLTK